MRRRTLVAAAFVAALGGCGFKLRGAQTLPIDTLFLALPPNSPLAAEISRVVRSSTNARVVTDRKQAQAVFELLGDRREREVVSVNAQGQASEYQLRLLATFRVSDPNGVELIPPTTLATRRDISFNASELLGKESEEAMLYRDMQSDLVRQMVTRLQGIRLDATPG